MTMTLTSIALIPILILAIVDTAAGSCPGCDSAGCIKGDGKDVVRIGSTRFYMLNKDTDIVNFDEAKGKCLDLSLSIASIKTIEEDQAIGRWIENYCSVNNITQTNWWIDVEYIKPDSRYEDGNGEPLTYQNFLHKYFPTGVGDNTDYNITGNDGEGGLKTCGIISLPWGYNDMGYQYSWREMNCRVPRRVLCEAQNKCDGHKNDWNKESERYKGFFPLSAGKYVVSWDRVTKAEANHMCANMSLLLLDVHDKHDLCLLNLIKRHRREVTQTHFWTSWEYDLGQREFTDSSGNQRGSLGIQIIGTRTGVRNKYSNVPKFCVSLLYAFEHQNSCNCPWKYVQTIPSVCDLPNGVICQGDEHLNTPCVYDLLFPLEDNGNVYRSDDKADYFTAEIECRRYGLTLLDVQYIDQVVFPKSYDKVTEFWVYSPNGQINSDPCQFVKYQNGRWLTMSKLCSLLNFYLCAENKGSSSHSGRAFQKSMSLGNNVIPAGSQIQGRSNKKNDRFKAPEYFVGEKASFKRSQHNCHQRGMEMLSADDGDDLDYLQSVAARQNTTIWIYSKHVDRAKKYRFFDDHHNTDAHHVCTTINRFGSRRASNCKTHHRYICTYGNN